MPATTFCNDPRTNSVLKKSCDLCRGELRIARAGQAQINANNTRSTKLFLKNTENCIEKLAVSVVSAIKTMGRPKQQKNFVGFCSSVHALNAQILVRHFVGMLVIKSNCH